MFPDEVRVNVTVKDNYINYYLKNNSNSSWGWKSWYKEIRSELNDETKKKEKQTPNPLCDA